MDNPEIVEHFYGVYLLYCLNPKYKGRTYIGYTVDPRRRIKQHNNGREHGGAKKTSNKGPWNMVLIVHGFPNNICALRFEWAWQRPQKSRRLKHVSKRKSGQTLFEFYLMVLSEMLHIGPWCRLPLTIRWLDYNFGEKYINAISSPLHMPICYGKVVPRKVARESPKENENPTEDRPVPICSICYLISEENELISCINPNCCLRAHLTCLAEKFTTGDKVLPIEGTCPSCNIDVLWGDLIRKMIGCYQDLQNDVDNTAVIIINDDDI